MAGLSALSSAVFALRILLGGLLITAGALKAGQFAFMASTIAGYRILPQPLIMPLAVILPFFEIGLGIYLAIGLFTRVAAWIAVAQFAVFSIAVASVVMRGIPISCGCFGPADTARASWLDVVRDLGLVVLAALIALRAPGRFAIDNYIGEKL